MTSNGIPLRAALQHFLGPARWAEFVAHYPSCEAAWSVLDNATADPGMLAIYHAEVASSAEDGAERAQADLARLEPARQLLEHFEAYLRAGEASACGVHVASSEERPIRFELPGKLNFDFSTSRLTAGDHRFVRVRIRAASAPNPKALVERCLAWLKARRLAKGDETKKVLLEAARAEFGKALTTRRFGEAFRELYGHARGRPSVQRDK